MAVEAALVQAEAAGVAGLGAVVAAVGAEAEGAVVGVEAAAAVATAVEEEAATGKRTLLTNWPLAGLRGAHCFAGPCVELRFI